ncbi:unnamed protein product [Macrosiphum euphorbiae]|uniref:Uncharacterized protein n=1 Tax=Macrosiphum euphorbiae TaxID=13131 RepID=A0AAV0X7G1_9HEMI|nr:unnamed protein product [Macrosiphum euphorbiae]
MVTAKTTDGADVQPPRLTIRSSQPNRFLMESIRSTTRRPLELSTDSVTSEQLGGDSGPARSMVRRRHGSAIKRRPLRRTFHTALRSSTCDRPSSFVDS